MYRTIGITSGVVAVIAILLAAVVFAEGARPNQNEYWDNGKLRVSMEYDGSGDPVKVRYYDENGSLLQMEKYDDLGRKIGESYYDGRGKLKETADGWAAMRWKYLDGKMSEECYYDDEGHLIERKQYNKLGDLVSKQYVGDENILPAEEYNPELTVAGETISYYDQNGRPEATTAAFGGPMCGDGPVAMVYEIDSAEETAMDAARYGD